MFEQLKQKYSALSHREQLLVSGSILVAITIIWFLAFLEPAQLQSKNLSKETSRLEQDLVRLREQYQQLVEQRAADPNRAVKDRIAMTDKQLEQINQQLARKFHGLIEPKMMARILESILQKHGRLKLLSVKSLPSEPLITTQENSDTDINNRESPDSEEEVVTVYKHGIQISFEGDYLSTHAYLKTLQELEWEFFWDEVQLDITKYPKARIVITVHTLSLKDSWIGV